MMFKKLLSVKSSLIIGLAGLFLFTGCEKDEFEATVDDDDEIEEEEHSLAKFNQVKVKDHVDLQLHHGNEHRAKIKAEEDIIGDVRMQIKGDELVIDIHGEDDDFIIDEDVTAHIYASKIKRVIAKESGDVKIPSHVLANQAKVHLKSTGDADITTETTNKLTLISDGSGDFDLSGETKKLIVNLRGSGDLDGEAFTAEKANLNTRGSGDIKVSVEESLKASTYGSGDIQFKGNPTIKHMDQDGSGDIEKVD